MRFPIRPLAAAAGAVVTLVWLPGLVAPAAASSPQPIYVAHRGGADFCPENTLQGVQCGVDAGASTIELDVWTLADGKLAVHHDPTMDRATDCTGNIITYTAPEFLACRVDTVPAIEQCGPSGCPTTLLLPVLEEFGNAVWLAPEPKNPGTCRKVMDRFETSGVHKVRIFTGNYSCAEQATERGFHVGTKTQLGLTVPQLAELGVTRIQAHWNVARARVQHLANHGIKVWIAAIKTQENYDTALANLGTLFYGFINDRNWSAS